MSQGAWGQLPVKVQTPTNTKARNLLEKAQQQTKERDFIKAIETLGQLNEKFPSFGEPYLLKGSLLKAIGDNRGALAAYRDGLSKVPTEASHASEYQPAGRPGVELRRLPDRARRLQAADEGGAENPKEPGQIGAPDADVRVCAGGHEEPRGRGAGGAARTAEQL
ncbi:hypothetical protein ACFQT0_16210 [Hymenobacter humi]|uniref:Tetratricopeptide repeat protein n=1 Tax=Hymenobacter humi TaxID=1411620 RepID=A0ABW2U981_9BACT